MNIADRFKDKVAVVTGAADGIGKGVAWRLAKEGAKVALFDVNQSVLAATVRAFTEAGLTATGFPLDISSETDVAAAVKEVAEKWGGLDVLVHGAGIVGPTSTKITDYPVSEFDRINAVNLKGSFLITQSVLRIMAKTGTGRILLICSIAGKEGNPGMVGYSSTKAGMIGMVKGVAKEFADTKITVNGLAPAVIRTPMNENTSAEQLAYMTAKIPMARVGTIEEVAAMCCFIVSEENSFSTGFIYDISGGRATY